MLTLNNSYINGANTVANTNDLDDNSVSIKLVDQASKAPNLKLTSEKSSYAGLSLIHGMLSTQRSKVLAQMSNSNITNTIRRHKQLKHASKDYTSNTVSMQSPNSTINT